MEREGRGGKRAERNASIILQSHPSLLLPAVSLLLSSPSHMTTPNGENHRAGSFPDADPCIRYGSYHRKTHGEFPGGHEQAARRQAFARG